MPRTRRVRQVTDEAPGVEEQRGGPPVREGWFSAVAPLAIASECYVGLILVPYILPVLLSKL